MIHSAFKLSQLSETATPPSRLVRALYVQLAMSSAAEASVSAAAQEQTVPTYADREQMDYLFTKEVGLDADMETVTATLDILAEHGITKSWQLKKLPDTLLEKWMPLDSSLQEYLVAAHVRDTLQSWDKQQATAQSQSNEVTPRAYGSIPRSSGQHARRGSARKGGLPTRKQNYLLSTTVLTAWQNMA